METQELDSLDKVEVSSPIVWVAVVVLVLVVGSLGYYAWNVSRRVYGQTGRWSGSPDDGAIWSQRADGKWLITAKMHRGLGYWTVLSRPVSFEVFTLPPPGEVPFPLLPDVPNLEPPWPWKPDVIGTGTLNGSVYDDNDRALEEAAEAWIDNYLATGGDAPPPGENIRTQRGAVDEGSLG